MSGYTNLTLYKGVPIHPEEGCYCLDNLRRNTLFPQYDKEKDSIGTSFDDFGYEVYKDKENKQHKIYFHHHLGIVLSFTHPIFNEDGSEVEKGYNAMECVSKYVKDNSIIPLLQKFAKKDFDMSIYKENDC